MTALTMLKRVDLLEVDLDGNVRLTERGIERLAASAKETLESGGAKTDR